MTSRCVAIMLMIGSSLMLGCTAQARSPEPVPLDRVECARCRMLISTEAGVGEIVSARDETRFYDDLGCLAADWETPHTEATAFVRLSTGSWSDIRDVFFAQPASARTAMGSGFAAFATAADARAADRAGRALGWDEVVKLMGARP